MDGITGLFLNMRVLNFVCPSDALLPPHTHTCQKKKKKKRVGVGEGEELG